LIQKTYGKNFCSFSLNFDCATKMQVIQPPSAWISFVVILFCLPSNSMPLYSPWLMSFLSKNL